MTELSTIPISRLNNTELDTKIKTEIDKNGIDLSTITTNCITEIPQDIKLELINWYCFEPVATAQYYYSKTPTITVGSILWYYRDESDGEAKVISIETNSNGTFYTIEVIKEHYNFEVGYTFSNVRRLADEDIAELVLRAGSKVYIPNGFEEDGTTPKFDEVVVSNDVIWEKSTTAGTRMAIYNIAGALPGIVSAHCHSGDTATMNSTTAYTYNRFYNTETNKIYVGDSNGGSWVEVSNSLPIGIFKNDTSGNVTSIDKVFNGFGYIGSTEFVLPGVKGLVPNGRNEDGSLKNIEVVSEEVITYTRTINGGPFVLGFTNKTTNNGYQYYVSSEVQPTDGYCLWYKPSDNFIYEVKLGVVTGIYDKCIYGTEIRNESSPYNITSFKSKTAFYALDYNDKSTIIGWSMPSDNYVNTTFVKTAVGSYTYTAPANGYFTLGFTSNTSGNTTALYKNNVAVDKFSSAGHNGCVFFAFKKGDVIKVEIAERALYAIAFQRFFYMEGEI